MSDILVGGPPPGAPEFSSQSVPDTADKDRKRSAISLAVAAGLHAAAILLVAIVVTAGPAEQPLPPISVNLLLASSPTPSVQPALAGTAGASNASTAVLPGSTSGGASSNAAGDGFVIPSPRSLPSGSSAAATTGPGFRTAGGTAGGGASLPAVQSTAPGATLPANQSGTSSGTGGSATQRSGQGVAVGNSAGTTQGTLDLSSLDKAMAGSTGGSGGGKAGATGATATGSASAGGGAATGSSNTGPNYSVVWDKPDASKGRQLLITVKPAIPDWVGKQGLNLKIRVSFSLQANGLLTGVKVAQSSGYADVDSAVVRAISMWRFTTAPGSPSLTGEVPYEIKPD